MYRYRVDTIDKIVDGDTVDVTIDLGFDILHRTRVRLSGIDAPESRTRDLEEKKLGLAAKERLSELLYAVGVNDEREILLLHTTEKGKYGRYLGEFIVYHSEKGDIQNLNLQMIEEGHAVEYNGGKR